MGSELRDITVNEVLVPYAGEQIHELEIARWLVADGSQVEYGDEIVTLKTGKVSQEIIAEFTGEITILAEEKESLAFGNILAEIRSNEEDLRDTAKKKLEPSITKVNSDKPSSSSALVKLVVLVILAFVLVKYGAPLMNQISDKSTEVFDKKESGKSKSKEESTTTKQPSVTPTSEVRTTDGYAAWEPDVREQIEYWIGEGMSYKLLSIDVNDSKDIMEIRYRTQNKEGLSSREKMVLKKDGFGERFIYTEGDKEFLVRPPE